MQDDTAVHLQLRLTRSTQSHASLAATAARATALTLQVRPESLQSGQHIAMLCQFHLRLGLGCLCTHGEDIQNQRCAVQDLHLQFLLDVTDLLGTQFIVEDNHTYGLGHIGLALIVLAMLHGLVIGILTHLDILSYFFQFSTTYIGHTAGTAHLLRKTLHGASPCCRCQEFQFVQIFVCLSFVLLSCNQSY